MMRNDASLMPLAMVALAIAFLSGMDALVKLVAPDFPTWQIVLLRLAFGILMAMPFYLWNWSGWPRRGMLMQGFIRSLTGIITVYCFFHALTLLPLAKAVALTFCAPLFLALLARVFLNEPIGGRALAAIGFGFAGVLAMLWRQLLDGGGGENELLGAMLALIASVTYAISIILTRLHGQNQNAADMIILQGVFATLLVLPLGVSVWQPVPGSALVIFVAIGLLGTAGQFMMIGGFARANAARLGPLEYTGLIWASLFGLVFFNEIPTTDTVAGAALIVLASLLLARR